MDAKLWVNNNTIFHGVLGSRAYGLHNENSDYDYRGVCVAPKDYYLGLHNFEQLESKDPDSTIFDIKKFFKLALECNPNIVEYMFLHEENILKSTAYWDRIRENRELFLSKRAKHRYLGYAFAQLKRVKSHKQWLLNPVENKPTRAEFGLPEAVSLSKELIGSIEAVAKLTLKTQLDKFLDEAATEIAAIELRNFVEFDLREELDTAFTDFAQPTIFNKLVNNLGAMTEIASDHFSEEIMATFTKEKQFDNAMQHWKQYQNWLKTRNESRAELEKKFGFDTKHVGHVFRLLIQGEEILKDGNLHVKLRDEDKEFVLAIKNGKYSYDEVLDMADKRMIEFDKLYEESKLPHSPDFNKANNLLVSIISDFHEVKNV